MKRGTFPIFLLAALLSSPAFPEGGPRPDGRVGLSLDRLGLKYTVNSFGNYLVRYSMNDGRAQSVYVISENEELVGIGWREVYSVAGYFETVPQRDTMSALLADNSNASAGAWALEKQDDETYLLFYAVKLPVDSGDDVLEAALELCVGAADMAEKTYFGVDEN